jgi:tRNA (mo5U34)-methyltransferase
MKNSRNNVKKICAKEHVIELEKILDQKELETQSPYYQQFREILDKYSHLKENDLLLSLEDRFVNILPKNKQDLSTEELKSDLSAMNPWRKGPFRWRGVEVEAEWDSHIKWKRLEKVLGPVWGKKILDVGCNNGYYMLRLSEQNPEYILGIDPTIRFYYQYLLLTKGVHLPMCDFQLLGLEHLHFFPKTFDVILFLGILYHHSDPIGQLKRLKASLNKGGKVIVEVQGIDDEKDISLFPHKRYAKAPGVWFLPSVSCLKNMMHRAGFRNIECISSEKTGFHEQRNSEFCPRPFETLEDFLDPKDSNLTIEGYPAPFRHLLIGQ